MPKYKKGTSKRVRWGPCANMIVRVGSPGPRPAPVTPKPNDTPPQPDGSHDHAPPAKRNLFPADTMPVTELKNGEKLGKTLEAIGFKTIGDLRKQLKEGFVFWLQSLGANSKEQEDIYNAVINVAMKESQSTNKGAIAQ